jgi:hypothetical protein
MSKVGSPASRGRDSAVEGLEVKNRVACLQPIGEVYD